MKNKTLSFLLAGVLLGHTVPAHSLNFMDLIPFYLGSVFSIFHIEIGNNIIQATRTRVNIMSDEEFKKTYKDTFEIVEPAAFYKAYENDLQIQLNEWAHKNHGLHNVRFLCSKRNFTATSTCNAIMINEQYYEFLLQMLILSKNKDGNSSDLFSSQNMRRVLLSCGIAKDDIPKIENILAFIEGTLHHECAHLKHKSSEVKMKINALKPMIQGGLLSAGVAYVSSTEEESTLKKITTMAATIVISPILTEHITNCIHLLFGKYDEMRADEAVPNDLRLLREQEKCYKTRHDNLMKNLLNPENFRDNSAKTMASIIPSTYFEKHPGIFMESLYLQDEHPSDYFRWEQFKKRRLALELQYKTTFKAALKNDQHPELKNTIAAFKPSVKVLSAVRRQLNHHTVN
jgi:hypothetical protein